MGEEKKKNGELRTISGRLPWKPVMQNIPYSTGSFAPRLRKLLAEHGKDRWSYEHAVKVFNEHCPQVCAMFQGKFSTQAEYNAAYEAEMNKRLAHTGWTEAQIVSVIYNRAAVEMDAYYAPMRSKL